MMNDGKSRSSSIAGGLTSMIKNQSQFYGASRKFTTGEKNDEEGGEFNSFSQYTKVWQRQRVEPEESPFKQGNIDVISNKSGN